jgi:hypothetical protein
MRFIWMTLLVMTAVSLFGFGTAWSEGGVPIRQGGNIEWSRSAAVLTDGNIVYIWSDTRLGDRDVWAQKVDTQGNLLWGANPVMVNGSIDRQEDPVGIGTTDGGVIVAWVDFRHEEAGDIYAQKLNANGELQWATEGLPLAVASNIQISINIIQDLSGGAYIIWEDQRNVNGDIYGVHLDADGDNLWTDNGMVVAGGAGEQNSHTFWEDGQGGGIMGYVSNPSTKDIRACRVLSNGAIDWDINVCNAPLDQEEVKMAKDSLDTFIFTWRDRRNDTDGDIYARRVDIDGNLLWTTEHVVYAGAGSKQDNPRVTSLGDGISYIAWQDNRVNNMNIDLYCQKLDANGNLLWDTNGVCLSDYQNNQLDPRLQPDGAGGCIIVWVDERDQGHPYEDIYMQRVLSSGSLAWAANGIPLCDAANYQFGSLIKRYNTQYYVSWGDQRDGSVAINVQTLDASCNPLLQANGVQAAWGLSGLASGLEVKKQNSDAVIMWKDTRFPNAACNFVQVLGHDQEIRFPENGVAVVTSQHDQDLGDFCLDDNNRIALAWPQLEEGYKRVYTQVLDEDGNRVLSDSGLAISDQPNAQAYSQIERLGANDYFVGWSNIVGSGFVYKYEIFLQRLANGALPWGATGKLIALGNSDFFLQGIIGHYLLWQDQYDVYLTRVDDEGNIVTGWPENGLLLADGNTSLLQQNPKGVLTSDGGIVVYWEDTRNGDSSIYAQYINAAGQIQWTQYGIPIANEVNDQNRASAVRDASNNFYMSWADFRNGFEDDIYMQKFNLGGNLLWNATGVAMCDKDSTQTNPSSVFTSLDGTPMILTAWEDLLADFSNINCQLTDLNGVNQWSLNGDVINASIKKQQDPELIPIGSQAALAIWIDGRSSGKEEITGIYGQRVYVGATDAVGDHNAPSPIGFMSNYPNPFNPITTISFSLKSAASVDLSVYNLRGEKVTTLVSERREAGAYKAQWNGTDQQGRALGNGVYFYRLSTPGSTETRKMVLLK